MSTRFVRGDAWPAAGCPRSAFAPAVRAPAPRVTLGKTQTTVKLQSAVNEDPLPLDPVSL
ncbi:hypothetical protein GCM10009835_15100 [Planosporangium flavigriseum]|uniref:Uncharacterized protein n=1 Tax=Planosporangium flavigriseum TaxID=373681 RepID=A0A8J3LWD2_9ACTN|nr:hypothetical protein Pfl04_31850 [Planosporangium flavigriseum]